MARGGSVAAWLRYAVRAIADAAGAHKRHDAMTEAPVSVREVVRLLLEADSYPRLSNEDWPVATRMEAAAPLFRSFGNRRQLAAYAGLAPTPWRSGTVDQEQGISKAGNRRLRRTMIELAWLWQRHQPASTLSRWFHTRVGSERGRIRRISIVALARKLLIAVWRYVTQGEVPEGAVLKAA